MIYLIKWGFHLMWKIVSLIFGCWVMLLLVCTKQTTHTHTHEHRRCKISQIWIKRHKWHTVCILWYKDVVNFVHHTRVTLAVKNETEENINEWLCACVTPSPLSPSTQPSSLLPPTPSTKHHDTKVHRSYIRLPFRSSHKFSVFSLCLRFSLETIFLVGKALCVCVSLCFPSFACIVCDVHPCMWMFLHCAK